MPPRGLAEKKKDKKKKVNFKEVEKKKTYSTKVPVKYSDEKIKTRVNQFLSDVLDDRKYNVDKARSWSVDMSAQISGIVREESPNNYKHVVMTMIGSVAEKPSIFLGSRCLWNEVTDSFTSIRYSNSTLYCVVLIYALFYQKN